MSMDTFQLLRLRRMYPLDTNYCFISMDTISLDKILIFYPRMEEFYPVEVLNDRSILYLHLHKYGINFGE